MVGVVSFARVISPWLAGAAFVAALAGCGQGTVALHPVQGQVLFEGRPAAGVQVVFHPAGDAKELAGMMPTGTTGEDGSFTLTTHPHGAGAPAGEFVVVATWYPPNGRELDNPRNKLPGKYANAGEPLLKAKVAPGENKLEPFRLTK